MKKKKEFEKPIEIIKDILKSYNINASIELEKDKDYDRIIINTNKRITSSIIEIIEEKLYMNKHRVCITFIQPITDEKGPSLKIIIYIDKNESKNN